MAVIDITPRQPMGFAHSIFTVGRYHDEAAPRGRTHRVLVAIHPSVPAHAMTHRPEEA